MYDGMYVHYLIKDVDACYRMNYAKLLTLSPLTGSYVDKDAISKVGLQQSTFTPCRHSALESNSEY